MPSAASAVAVFTYLAELHDCKLSNGMLPQGVAMPALEPGTTAGAAAAAGVTSTSAGDNMTAAGVTATVIAADVCPAGR